MGQLEPGAVPFGGKIIYYYIEARDNDDPTGFECDGQSRWPKTAMAPSGSMHPGTYTRVLTTREPDDALSIASELSMGVHSGRRLCGGSPDYIRFTPPASGTLVVRVVYGESHGALLDCSTPTARLSPSPRVKAGCSPSSQRAPATR